MDATASSPCIQLSADIPVAPHELSALLAALQALPGVAQVLVLPLPAVAALPA